MSVHRRFLLFFSFLLLCFLLWNDSDEPPETPFVPGTLCGLSFFPSLIILFLSSPSLTIQLTFHSLILFLFCSIGAHCLWLLSIDVGGGPINGANGNWPDDDDDCVVVVLLEMMLLPAK